jgi:tetratricopeptide (TPR) repeat protein
VALKVLKPGMDTRQVVARFEAERQALALMDHPNIARVFDGGATASGRPYFVMELVRGEPITQFADRKRLSVRERLGLFVSVCQAVQHAHQKGIIHRDLKPSNILVTMHDATPVVKVIDFGIAKALGQELTDKTLFTGFAQLVGTPQYMSPEQAGESGLDIDTRSDVYSLGVLLYELLTGTTPFDKGRFKQAAYDEIRRIIREEEPPKPSTRLSTTVDLATIAANRGLEPKKLSRLVRGELDWIVMKCLEKDRNRRYETVSGLARDVERYLRDEAVQACPPSAWYRFRKFARRNRAALAAAAAALVVVVLAVVGLAASNLRIRQEKDRTEGARQQAQRNLRLALKALDEIYLRLAEQRLPRDPRGKEEDRELLKNALAFYRQFADENGADAAVSLDVIRAYRRVGDIERFVGEHVAARRAYAEAVARAEELATGAPDEPDYAYELAVGRNALGEILVQTGDVPAANEQLRPSIDALTRLARDFPARPQHREELARAYHVFGRGLRQQGRKAAAEEQFRWAIDLQTRLAKEFRAVPRYRADLAQMHRSAGRWYLMGVDDQQAQVGHLRRACELLRGLVKEFPAVPLYRQRLGGSLGELSVQSAESGGRERHWQEAIELQTKLAADFPTVPEYLLELTVSYINMGSVLYFAGQVEQSVAATSKGLELSRRLFADFPDVPLHRQCLATALLNWAQSVLIRTKDVVQARDLLDEAVRHLRRLVQAYPQHLLCQLNLVASYDLLAGTLAVLGQQAEADDKLRKAEQVYRKTVAIWRDLPGGPSNLGSHCKGIVDILLDYADVWMKVGKVQEAVGACERALRFCDEGIKWDPKNKALHSLRAVARERLKKYSAAKNQGSAKKPD